jgi:hypothetical protein
MTPIEFIAIVLIVILIAAGIIWLQIFLSKKENKWPGLILPLISVCVSLYFIMFITPVIVMDSALSTTFETVSPNGDVLENVIMHVPQQSVPDVTSMIFMGIYVFVLFNIPTAVLFAIYAACRVKRKRDAELAKMNIQDL